MTSRLQILVDGDACPVKEEVYKVAWRMDIPVILVANSYLRVPDHPLISRVVVGAAMDAADDHIAELSDPRSLVVTADILLADRCIKAGATVLAPTGKPFTANSIGAAVATRAIMQDLRAGGENVGGAKPFTKADRSRFLSAMDTELVRLQRAL